MQLEVLFEKVKLKFLFLEDEIIDEVPDVIEGLKGKCSAEHGEEALLKLPHAVEESILVAGLATLKDGVLFSMAAVEFIASAPVTV